MDLRALLSPTQLAAATTIDAPVCILAGAGSGKTRVITHRIAWLIEEKIVSPWTILAVTFTNKAAGEMRSRVDKLVPGKGSAVQVGTFHGMAARLLRQYGRAVGVPPGFVIYDQDDADRLLKRIVTGELNMSAEVVRPIRALIEDWQSNGWAADDVPGFKDAFTEKALDVYRRYVDRMQAMGGLDFGSLLVKLRDLLKLPAGEDVRARVRHVLVDEYQDVNAVQSEIVLMLAKTAATTAVVGDDDQAIYGWRGASAENLRRFLEAMPGSILVKLEENYRSTATILQAANGIISKNELRLGKTLRATGAQGRRVRVVRAQSDLDESRKVVSMIEDHVRAGGSLDEAAILYRTNSLSRPFEDELRKSGFPYRIVGGVRFYDRKEVKDVLATLRAALNPKSDVDTLRMLQAVPRGVGSSSLEKVEAAARKAGDRPLLEALGDAELLQQAGISTRTIKQAIAFAAKIEELGDKLRGGLSAGDAVALAVEVSGVGDRLEAEGSLESEGRLEVLDELRTAAAEHALQQQALGQTDDVQSFLEAASLLSSTDLAKDDGRGVVTLMSLHSAKGLEFELVFLVALEENGFPHSRAVNEGASREDLEEERRLAYVGITRARKHLVLTYADRRMLKGAVLARQPSRFLFEIPPEAMDGDAPRARHTFGAQRSPQYGQRAASSYGPSAFPPPTSFSQPARRVVEDGGRTVEYDAEYAGIPAKQRVARTTLATTLSVDEAAAQTGRGFDTDDGAQVDELGGMLRPGARVWHKSFGEGVIVGVRGGGKMTAALVRFEDDRQPRVIIARHLTLAGPKGGDDPDGRDADDVRAHRVVPDETA